MRLEIDVALDCGGHIRVSGEDLSAEDINEVMLMLSGHAITTSHAPATRSNDD
jgi:hypothetical protein